MASKTLEEGGKSGKTREGDGHRLEKSGASGQPSDGRVGSSRPPLSKLARRIEGHEVWIVSGCRSPFVKAGAEFRDVKAVPLGVRVVTEALDRAHLKPEEVDEVVLGNTGNPEDAANISRVVALESGIPQWVPAYTVHRNCASAMESVYQGFWKIKLGLADTVVVGGTESMSNIPLLFNREMTEFFAAMMRARSPLQKLQVLSRFRPHFLSPVIAIQKGLTDPVSGMNMGLTAELIGREAGISRQEQDEFAMRSHERAVAAQKAGRLSPEIVGVAAGKAFDKMVSQDIGPRDGQNMASLAKLKPYFDRRNGTVTVGNACPITDGAAALVLMRAEKARAEGRKPLARIRAASFAALEPERMGLGPVYSTPKALEEAGGLKLSQMDLVELNEAFAVQVLACQRAFGSKAFCQDKLGLSDAMGEIPADRLNVNGGAIALGHPVGATGARLVLTAAYEMQRRAQAQFALATLCIGGGQGGSVVLEKV